MFGKNSKIDAIAAVVTQVLQAEAKLSPKQKKEIDKNHNGKIDGQDFSILRGMKKEEVTTDTTKGREKGSINSFTPAKVTLKGDVEKKPDPKEPEETTARKSIEAKGVKTEETVQEVSPPGWSGTVKAMKKHKKIDNPFALAWSMKKKGAKPHYKPEAKNEEVEIEEGLKDLAKKSFKALTGGSDKDHLDRLKKDMYGDSEVKYAAKTLVKHAKDPLGLKKEEVVAEGLGKDIKRAAQGWGGAQDKPADIVKRNKGYDTDTAKKVRAHLDNAPDHTPAGLQKRVLDRKLKGVAEGAGYTVDDEIQHWKDMALHWARMGDEKSMLKCKANLKAAEQKKKQGVAEGLPQTLRKVVPGHAKREIDKKMDAGKFGKTDADKDANFQRYKKIQDKLKEQGVAEGSQIERKISRTQALIQDYYNRARASKNDIKRDHYIDMARQLEYELEGMINDANEQERDSNMVSQHDATPSATWNRGGLKEQGVAEGSYDDDKGITHTRGSLVAKLEALPKGSDDFEWNRIQAIHHLKQGNMLRAKYYMALMKRGEQGVAEGDFTISDDPSANAKLLFLKTINGNEYRLVKQGNDVYKIYVNRSTKNKQVFPSFDLAKKALQQLLLNAVHTDEQGVAEAAPGWLRHTAGAATGALAGVGASFPGAAVAGPVGGAVAGAYGAKSGYELGAKAADWVYDKVTGKRVPADSEVDEELTMKHQRDHHTQRRPDISNSLADRGFDMSEKPNVTKSADGHPTVKWRHHGHAGHTRVEPTLNPTTVQRKDTRPIPSWLKKEQEVDEAGMLGFMQPEPGKPEAKKPKLTLSQIRDLSKQEDERSAQYVRSNDLPRNPDHMRVVHDDVELGELSNELLDRYKKELGVRATAADRAGDYDQGHEYFKKINRATIRQGENDARRHAEKENDMMETRLNMMRKAGYDL